MRDDAVEPARAGIRAWVRSGAAAAKAVTPAGIAAFLTASALAPVAFPLLGGASAAVLASAVVGLLGGMGGNFLADVLTGTAQRLRSGPAPTLEEFRDSLAADLQERLGEHGVRADMARVLDAVGAAEAAVTAAVAESDRELAEVIVTALEHLGGRYAEFGPLLDDVRRSVDALHRRLEESDVTQHQQAAHVLELLVRVTAIQDLLERPVRPAGEPGTAVGRCPYPGLTPFTEDDARWFFGRAAATGAMVVLLNRIVDGGDPLLLVGASGAGKSSLLAAGLLPQIRAGRVRSIDTAVRLVPTGRPMDALAEALATVPAGERCVLVVDQFEEIFTLCDDPEQRAAFVAELARLTAGTAGAAPLPVVIAVRADFYDRCAALPGLAGSMRQNALVLGPMGEDDLRRAIVAPARRAGVELEPELVERLLGDLGVRHGGYQAGALPLLAQALESTWERGGGHRMTLAGYLESGGIRNAVTTRADGVYRQLGPADRAVARRVLLRLVTSDPAGTGEATRRRASVAELTEVGGTGEVLRHLVDARLVIVDDGTAQLTHEALVREWATLAGWVAEDRDWLRVHRELTAAAQAWDELGRDPDALYRGSRLAVAGDAAAGREADLSPLERDFLQASAALAGAEAAAARGRTRRLRQLVAALAVLLVCSLVAVVVAVQQRGTAEEQRRIALSRQYAAEALSLRESDERGSMLLALAAWRTADTAEARGAMFSAAMDDYLGTLAGHDGAVHAAALSHDGTLAASGGADGTVRLWDVATKRELAGFAGGDRVVDVAFSPDATLLASAVGVRDGLRLWNVETREAVPLPDTVPMEATTATAVGFAPDGRLVSADLFGTVHVWDQANRQPVTRLTGHQSWVRAMTFSPDGTVLVTAGQDGTVRTWDLATGRQLAVLTGHTLTVQYVAFHPDGRRLASSSLDGTVRVWDVAAATQLETLTVRDLVPAGLVFSSDGRRLYVGGDLREIKSWDTADWEQTDDLASRVDASGDLAIDGTGRTLVSTGVSGSLMLWGIHRVSLHGHDDVVSAVAFDPTGNRLASGGLDNTVWLWDAERREPLHQLRGHTEAVAAVEFTPDGDTLASTGDDGTVRLWDVESGDQLAEFGDGDRPYGSLAFSPDGATLAVGPGLTPDHTDPASLEAGDPQLWDVRRGTRIAQLDGDDRPVRSVAYSPDGSRIVAVLDGPDATGSVRIWRASDLRVDGEFDTGHETVIGVAFSPDGSALATSGIDGALRLWNLGTLRQESELAMPSVARDMAFGPDGTTLATANEDEVVRLWDRATGTLTADLRWHNGGVNRIDFAPDGTLASGGVDTAVHLWDVDAGRVADTLCRTLTEPGFDDRWRRAAPDAGEPPRC